MSEQEAPQTSVGQSDAAASSASTEQPRSESGAKTKFSSHGPKPPVAAAAASAAATPNASASDRAFAANPDTAGLEAVKAAVSSGSTDAAVAKVVSILHAHPDERDAIMSWLQQHRGAAFAESVTTKTGEVERALPAGVDLQAVRASVMIPGKRKLGGGYTQGGTLQTREPTEVGVEVTHTGVRIFVSPGLYLDADWPLQDCQIDGAGLDFATKLPFANVNDVHGLGAGMISISSRIATMLTGMISKAVTGTKLVAGNYDPTQDPDLQTTMNKVLEGFVNLFSAGDGKEPTKQPPVSPKEMTHVSAGATISVRDGATFAKDGSGLSIGANGPLTFAVEGGGNVRDASAGKDPQAVADAVNIQAVHLTTDALQVMVKGEPVAKITSLTLQRGGKVTIDKMTPLGKLADAEAMESGFSLLAALVSLHEGGQSANGLYRNAQQPVVADGISRGLIEQTFTDALHKLIIDYRAAIPGLDLARALGIG